MKFNCQVGYVKFHAKLAPKLFQSLGKFTDFLNQLIELIQRVWNSPRRRNRICAAEYLNFGCQGRMMFQLLLLMKRRKMGITWTVYSIASQEAILVSGL